MGRKVLRRPTIKRRWCIPCGQQELSNQTSNNQNWFTTRFITLSLFPALSKSLMSLYTVLLTLLWVYDITVRRLCQIVSTHLRNCENTWKNRKQKLNADQTARKKSLKTLIINKLTYMGKSGMGEQIWLELWSATN